MTAGVDDGVPRCPVCRFRDLPGPLYLCAHCVDHLTSDLVEVAKLADRLDARPTVAGLDGRGPPGFRSRPPGRVEIWVARDHRSKPYPVVDSYDEDDRPIRGVWWTLSSWAQLIVESRGFTHDPPTGLHDLARWLTGQVDYVSRWPVDGPALAVDVRAQRNQLRSLTGDPNPKPAAYCIRLVDAETGPVTCGAPIFLPRGQTEIDHTQPIKLHCGAPSGSHSYSGLELLNLKLANDQGDTMEKSERVCPGCGHARDRGEFRRNGYCGTCNANQPPDCTCPSTYTTCRCGARKGTA